ncbi:MAG: methionine--tRNA ligase [bacterium]|nr:methionine--tRNA ligase [bacterium]
MARTFYVTTPIYYPDSDLHIGHAYTTVAADAIARWHRLHGAKTFFLTGTDEHAQKIERRARERGQEPAEFVAEMAARIRRLWDRLEIDYDDFIRTSEPRHQRVVQEIFERVYRQGDIYKAHYRGWYCTPCETFWLERRLEEGCCPDCRRQVEFLEEEAYFFRLSGYAGRLLEHIEANPDFIQPPSRRNEMVSFIRGGLEDLCVSRTTLTWGVPVPFDPRHVVYVWFDALTNYLSALGYGSADPADQERYETFWPADLHLVGKEIVRFHAIIWPIILMAAGIPLPRKVYGHGWLILKEGKISKSTGNVIDPLVLVDRYGVDAVRYYLLREIPFGADGQYSEEALVARTDADLANDIGNLLSRTTAMIERFTGGRIPPPGTGDRVLADAAADAREECTRAMDGLQLSVALGAILGAARRGNKYIEEQAPWELAKAGATARLDSVLYDLAELQRVLAVLLKPFLVQASAVIWEQLGVGDITVATHQDLEWGRLVAGTPIKRGKPLFPRIVSKGADR